MKARAITLSILLVATACTRTADNKALEDAPLSIGPTGGDVSLPLNPAPSEAMKKALVLDQEMSTSSYLRLSEDLQTISQQQRSEYLSEFSRDLLSGYRNQSVPKNKFSDSLYAQTMAGESETDARKEIDALARELKKASSAFSGLLAQSKKSFPWPKQIKSFSQVIGVGDAYFQWLSERISHLDISPEMKKPIKGAIKGEYAKLRPVIVAYSERLTHANSLAQALGTLKQAMSKFGVKVSGDQAQQFRLADELVRSIATAQSSQDALTLIIMAWRSVPAENREAVFKPAAPEFYDFLKDRDEASLDCLASSFCLNPVLEVARRMVILPKISEYGVDKIKKAIDEAARDHLVKSALAEASEMLPKVPDLIQDLMLAQTKKYTDLIATIRRDYPGFLRKSLRAWERDNFGEEIRGFEPSRVKARVTGRDKIRVALPKQGAYGVASGAEVLGTSLAVAHQFLPERTEKARAALLEPIVKVLAVTGFRQTGGKLFPGALLPIDGKRTELFDVRNLLKGKTTFAVPDAFIASDSMVMNRGNTLVANASVGAQAELLRGISRQIRFHRDWEENEFDRFLGQIGVDDIITEAPKGSTDIKAFPKELIFTLSVGGAGAILQNIVRDLSPAFLILPNQKLLWGDKYKEIGEGSDSISTVAGLVNIENGKRGTLARTQDISRYILALTEFLEATDGIENTKSAQLKAIGENGRSVLEELLEARRYLRLFQLGLTNFLVNVAQNQDGGFEDIYDVSTQQIEKSDRQLSTQVLAIRALLASSRTLEMPTYKWAALDAYYFMNRSLWSQENQFYASALSPKNEKMGAPSLPEIVAVIRACEELSPEMKEAGRLQWQRIARPWIRALEDF